MIRTLITTNVEERHEFSNCDDRYYWIKNKGETIVHVSAFPNVNAGEDNVVDVLPGECVMIENNDNYLYTFGEGKLEVHQQDYFNCPFEFALAAGGGSEEDNTLDELIDGSVTSIVSNASEIRTNAFNGCTNLKIAVFPVATEMGSSAFQGCRSLISVSVPQITKLNVYSFKLCDSLKNISFPLLTTIDQYAFHYCESLESIDFPLLTTTKMNVFENCTNLKTANFPLLTSIGAYTFQGCSSLESVDFPLLTTITVGTFKNCTNLKTANLKSATTVSASAFQGCSSLESVDFPLLTTIEAIAFKNCTNLKMLILRQDTVTLSNINAFDGTSLKNGTGYIYVPRQNLSYYTADAQWCNFAETQFRALEDYTIDGTTTSELDPTKI